MGYILPVFDFQIQKPLIIYLISQLNPLLAILAAFRFLVEYFGQVLLQLLV